MATSSGTLISQGSPASLAVVVPALIILAVLVSAVIAPDQVVEVSRGDFALVTIFLGGGAAWLSRCSKCAGWCGCT